MAYMLPLLYGGLFTGRHSAGINQWVTNNRQTI